MPSTRRRHLIPIITVTAALVAAMAPGAAAASHPSAPTTEQVTLATNAMLQPGDVPAGMATPKDPFDTTGYDVPAGGDDPSPVCILAPGYRSVQVPVAGAVGYQARSGKLFQNVYDYGSETASRSAWATLARDIATKCTGTWRNEDGDVTRIRNYRVPGPGDERGWSVTTTGAGLAMHSAAQLVGTSIQLVLFDASGGTITTGQRLAVDRLGAVLAARWRDRAALPSTQPREITLAQSAMLNPADVTEALPVTSAAGGGGSMLEAYAPGLGPNTCYAPARLPAGTRAFVSFIGGQDEMDLGTGLLGQQVELYPSAAAAQKAWAALRPAVLKCGRQPLTPPGARPPLTKSSSGVSPLVFDGVAGMWSRDWDRWNVDEPFSSKTYTVYLLVGNTVQSVTYGLSREGLRQLPLDQATVNALAEQLAMRWQAANAG